MHQSRVIAAAIGTVAILTSAAVVATAQAGNDAATTLPRSRTYVEPVGAQIADGTYLGLVRRDDRSATALLVDFVSMKDGVVGNARPARTVDAGLIATVDRLDPTVGLFDSVARPFRITISDNVVVGVESTDELPGA